jgi:putative transposase
VRNEAEIFKLLKKKGDGARVIECFMRTHKEECIWLNTFTSFREAKVVIERWIHEYNTERPHQ